VVDGGRRDSLKVSKEELFARRNKDHQHIHIDTNSKWGVHDGSEHLIGTDTGAMVGGEQGKHYGRAG